MVEPDQQPVVTVSLREIYDAVLRLTGRVEAAITKADHNKTEIDDHEHRLRSLERGRWPLPAVAVLLSAGAVAVAIVAIM